MNRSLSRTSFAALALIAVAAIAFHSAPAATAQGGFTTLFDGSNLDNFNPLGDANWSWPTARCRRTAAAVFW